MARCEQQPTRVHEVTSTGAFALKQVIVEQNRGAMFARDKYGGWYPTRRGIKSHGPKAK